TYNNSSCCSYPIAPPSGHGHQVPMVIVSPYARSGYTDSAVAGFASMLAFVEHAFGLKPLSPMDANAYDYANSFDFGQTLLAPVGLPHHVVPASSIAHMRTHPQVGG